jgi:hypothetical protein
MIPQPACHPPDFLQSFPIICWQGMKSKSIQVVLFCTLFFLLAPGARAIDPDLGRFSSAKQSQIRAFAETITNKVPAVVWRFYDAMRVDDWETASNLFLRISLASQRYAYSTNDEAITPALATLVWPPLSESYGAYENFHGWNNRWLHRFGNVVIKSIPPGSIYFGGTDPGRFVVSVLCESQVDGRPFFTLTQNQLADKTYVDYLRAMYGKKIYVPTAEETQQAFEDYAADVEKRRQSGKLKPGEGAQMVNGHLQVSGEVSVMEINGLIAKTIFDKNPKRDFFVEESFPLDWMYPYLSTHGLIFKLNREPLTELSEADISADHDLWKKLTDEVLGGWLDDNTSLQDVCDFALKYGLGRHLDDYKGDKDFAANDYARKCFSKLRSSQGGLYAWRVEHAKDADERDRMFRAAELAYRQAYAICPYSPEAIFRYVNLLCSRQRFGDAILIMKTSVELVPEDKQLKQALDQMMRYR